MKTTQSFPTAHWLAADAPLWVALIVRACDETSGALCCRPPRPLTRRERRELGPKAQPYRVLCNKRTTQPAGLGAYSSKGQGGGRASPLPARRSRQSASLISSQALTARGESTIGRAHRYCGQDQGARRRRCGDIVDDEQRRDCPQYLCAQRVPAPQGHLLRWRSSTISPYRLRRAALQLPLRRSERGLLYFHHGLLTPQVTVSAVFKLIRQIPGKGK
jgi:hypothetical protein